MKMITSGEDTNEITLQLGQNTSLDSGQKSENPSKQNDRTEVSLEEMIEDEIYQTKQLEKGKEKMMWD